MTQTRRQLVDPTQAQMFHCIQRCVRRSWLCGLGPYTQMSFEHRKSWVEARIYELGNIFACGIYGYAVMSNLRGNEVALSRPRAGSPRGNEFALNLPRARI
jgi:putative transposase